MHVPVEQLDVEKDVFSTIDHIELLSSQHDLFDFHWGGTKNDNCKYK